MNLLCVDDLGPAGEASAAAEAPARRLNVSWFREQSPQGQAKVTFRDPLTSEERAWLRWYLEQYLSFPYGAERWRAALAPGKMASWGTDLFAQLFPKPSPAWQLYRLATSESPTSCELCIASEDPAFLSVPWELLRDPARNDRSIALTLGGLYRQRRLARPITSPLRNPADPLRILLVIARPTDQPHIDLRTVAGPVLEALRMKGSAVQMDVLRPPTFSQLRQELTARVGFYDVVHFDGHGQFAGGGSTRIGLKLNTGYLIFEKPNGQTDPISSDRLVQELANCGIRLVVLNACQSAQESSTDAFSSVAAQLLAAGAKGVVAMSYSVYPRTAALFMEQFYGRLAAGVSLSEAVGAGRRLLERNLLRPSVVSQDLELHDWVVPALYQQEHGYMPFPGQRSVPATPMASPAATMAEQACPEGPYGFVGRDPYLLDIERALANPNTPWALVTGIIGSGKTELIRGFARWYAQTSGCPDGVYAVSLATSGLDDLLEAVFRQANEKGQEEDRLKQAVRYLRRARCLLVVDDLDRATLPVVSRDPMPEHDRQKLSRFLYQLRGGSSRVLLASRRPAEPWLGVSYVRVELSGIGQPGRIELARSIAARSGQDARSWAADDDFEILLDLLKGHPGAMVLVLREIRARSAEQVVDGLLGVRSSAGSIEDAGLAEAFAHLSASAREGLPFAGMFHGFLDPAVLAQVVIRSDNEQRSLAQKLGQSGYLHHLEVALQEASEVGLITPSPYFLPPLLPRFLRQWLPAELLARLNVAFTRSFARLWGQTYLPQLQEGDDLSRRGLAWEQQNIIRAWRLAEQTRDYRAIWYLLRAEEAYFQQTFRVDRWASMCRHTLDIIGEPEPEDIDMPLLILWTYLVQGAVKWGFDPKAQERVNLRVVNALVGLQHPDPEGQVAQAARELLAEAYLNLAYACSNQERDRDADVHQWLERAVALKGRGATDSVLASAKRLLARMAAQQDRRDEAVRLYNEALAMDPQHVNKAGAVDVYMGLGDLAQQVEQRKEFYDLALALAEEGRDFRAVANALTRRGDIAADDERRGNLYKRALAIGEQSRNPADIAADYGKIGLVARKNPARLDEAREWFSRALAIYEQLQRTNPKWLTMMYDQLHSLARERGQPDEAEEWAHKADAARARIAKR